LPTVHERNDNRRGEHDHSREVHLANEIRIDDEAVGSLAEPGRKERPWQLNLSSAIRYRPVDNANAISRFRDRAPRVNPYLN